ncbi:MAG: metal ABC transporter permease [Candidatus Omnitrophica bacterium]|nr:metal ABC transporter permease [Candidatus Omnitrophota bacterium]MDE2008916.1 metal ABC transporter permease [Candidatus Omnitrophota bacterium]MDE2213521.1 metal ABC transporter permease [Candidatus Omnitrophota bacterium]MDE2230578.1 metal ABC transporter permease [Candidatus Omnitrophota bacterium]
MNISPAFSVNIFSDLQTIFKYDFMLHAFQAGTIVAVVAGFVGYFIVLRRSAFAAHALSHVGFTGAAGACLIGLNPIVGLLLFTMSGGLLMGLLGRKVASRDIQIGTVLAFMLGLGVLFISLYSGYATEAYSLLFGEILGISSSNVTVTLLAGILILIVLAIFYRPLLFTSLDEDVAEAKGLSVLGIGLIFMLLIAVATSIAVQVVGVLLIFALMVTPAAIAHRLASRPFDGIAISVLIAVFATWLGLFISFYLPYPVSFFITSIVFVIYILVRLISSIQCF